MTLDYKNSKDCIAIAERVDARFPDSDRRQTEIHIECDPTRRLLCDLRLDASEQPTVFWRVRWAFQKLTNGWSVTVWIFDIQSNQTAIDRESRQTSQGARENGSEFEPDILIDYAEKLTALCIEDIRHELARIIPLATS